MLRRLYNWTLEKAAHHHAPRWLFGISFAESSFFPIPPDVLLGPLCLAQPKRAFYYAFICMLASVLVALLGYVIGLLLFVTVGKAILNAFCLLQHFEEFAVSFNESGWYLVMLEVSTPSLFKLITNWKK